MSDTTDKKIKKYHKHDSFFKQSLLQPTVAKEFFETYLPQRILEKVDLSTLKPERETFLDNNLDKGIVDMLFSVQYEGSKGYFYLLTEHQNKPDHWMPFRLYKYMLKICDYHLKKHPKSKCLPFIYPLIYYAGLEQYKAPLTLWELFEDPKFAKDCYTNPFQLIELQKIADEVLKSKVSAGVMSIIMKRISSSDILPYIEYLKPLLEILAKENPDYFLTTLVYTIHNADSEKEKKVVEAFKEIVPEGLRGDIMTIAERLMQQGKIEGLQQGKIEGKHEVALNLLSEGLPISIISKTTGLSEQLINELKKKDLTTPLPHNKH